MPVIQAHVLTAEEAGPIEDAANVYVETLVAQLQSTGVEGASLGTLATANGSIALMRAISRKLPDLTTVESEFGLGILLGVLLSTHDCPGCSIAAVSHIAEQSVQQMTGALHAKDRVQH